MIPRTFVPAMSASTEGPLAAPAPPRASRPVPADAFYGGFQPYEAQTPSREVGPQIYPSNYFRPYYPPQHASAIY